MRGTLEKVVENIGDFANDGPFIPQGRIKVSVVKEGGGWCQIAGHEGSLGEIEVLVIKGLRQ